MSGRIVPGITANGEGGRLRLQPSILPPYESSRNFRRVSPGTEWLRGEHVVAPIIPHACNPQNRSGSGLKVLWDGPNGRKMWYDR